LPPPPTPQPAERRTWREGTLEHGEARQLAPADPQRSRATAGRSRCGSMRRIRMTAACAIVNDSIAPNA
ncbi:MAG: hypothetical protein LC808_34420, partial [Actinobacteria bacterium]|nr:hypothetical protein [Actinomycetota bacterium]